MKYFALALFSMYALSSCSGPKHVVDRKNYPNPFEFTLIDTLTASKNELYVRAHEWLAKSYGSAKAVIEMQDKEAGKLIGKAIVTPSPSKVKAIYYYSYAGDIQYTISVDTRDNRFRIVFSDIYQKDYSYSQNGRTYTSSGFGSLSEPFTPKKDPVSRTIKPSREERYYELKNFCTEYFQSLLTNFKTYMETNPDKF